MYGASFNRALVHAAEREAWPIVRSMILQGADPQTEVSPGVTVRAFAEQQGMAHFVEGWSRDES